MTTRFLSWSRVMSRHPHLAGSVDRGAQVAPQVSFPLTVRSQVTHLLSSWEPQTHVYCLCQARSPVPGGWALQKRQGWHASRGDDQGLSARNRKGQSWIQTLQVSGLVICSQPQPLWPSASFVLEEEAGEILFLYHLFILRSDNTVSRKMPKDGQTAVPIQDC